MRRAQEANARIAKRRREYMARFRRRSTSSFLTLRRWKKPQEKGEVQIIIDAISKRHDANKLILKEQILLGGSLLKRSLA